MIEPLKFARTLSIVLVLAACGMRSGAEVEHRGTKPPAAEIARVKMVMESGSPALEIVCTRPITPVIQQLREPPRLIVDLPNVRMEIRRKRIQIRDQVVSAVRFSQFDQDSPIVRIALDLHKPQGYTWRADGNRLLIRLLPQDEKIAAKPPSAPDLVKHEEPVAVPVSLADFGNVLYADRLPSGAAVTSGDRTTILRLTRGGEVHVCPGTTVSVSHAQNGPDMLVGMGTGALEVHYALENSADSIQTPDFRVLLRGPGEFDLAIKSDARGNTCVSTLPGNTEPAIISEVIGESSFTLGPHERVLLRSGRLSNRDTEIHMGPKGEFVADGPECGCPRPSVPLLRASLKVPDNLPEAKSGTNVHLAEPENTPWAASLRGGSQGAPQSRAMAETSKLTDSKPLQIQVEAPLVYRASDAVHAQAPELAESRNLGVSALRQDGRLLPTTVLPPSPSHKPDSPKPRRSFFRKIGGFFKTVFG